MPVRTSFRLYAAHAPVPRRLVRVLLLCGLAAHSGWSLAQPAPPVTPRDLLPDLPAPPLPALPQAQPTPGAIPPGAENLSVTPGRIARLGRTKRPLDILSRMGTRINPPASGKFPPHVPILIQPLTLNVRTKFPAAIRPFLPIQPPPAQIFDHSCRVFPATALMVEILHPQNQRPLLPLRPLRCHRERAGVPQMQPPARRRCQPASIVSRFF